MKNCYCNSNRIFSECCEPYILGTKKTPTAETLMQSRYSAYCVQNVDYLLATTHISTRKFHDKQEMFVFASENEWVKLEIVNTTETTVEFKAFYIDNKLKSQMHHEISTFKKEEGTWFYVDGEWY
jgi:SEC-C motif-containing protein